MVEPQPGKPACPYGDKCHFKHDRKLMGRELVMEKINSGKWPGGKEEVLKALKAYRM